MFVYGVGRKEFASLNGFMEELNGFNVKPDANTLNGFANY